MAWQEKLPDAVKWGLVPYTRGLGLEIGCGPRTTFPHFVGVDELPNTKLFGSMAQPDMVVKDVTSLPNLAGGQYDFVFAPFHPDDKHKMALPEWWRLLKTGGHLCLYWNRSTEAEMRAAVKGWDLAHDEAVEWERADGEKIMGRFQVYRKLDSGGHSQNTFTARAPKPKKTVAVVRLGAFGDMVQTSSIFPGLKAEGFHLTLFTATRGYDVVKHDPHVDAFVLQDQDQIPIQELGEFWKWLKTRYTHFVNLSETVEGTLLAFPGRATHEWPHALRHALLDYNYLEVVHAAAGVPFPPKQKFYATDMEIAWAKKERQRIGGSKVILWTLSGSSIHKVWPYLDQIIARILTTAPDARIVLVGDELSQVLEQGWENEPRVVLRSGVWNIRQTLAFIDQADLLVGPETGVMNAAGFHRVPKIVTLSHSSVENLTRDWKNCTSLTPKATPCYPCHQLHYDSTYCPRVKRDDAADGVAACQADISADVMWDAVKPYLLSAVHKVA